MGNANNTENTSGTGRRSTDNKEPESVLSSPSGSLWGIIRNSVGVAFVLTVCVGVGRFSHTVDTNVKGIDENKQAIKEILIQNNSLILALTVSNTLQEQRDKQQTESDKRFEGKFDESNEIQKKVLDKLGDHDKQIIILNQKVSVVDKLSVYTLAMR
jgi:hypothetical protein